MFFVPRARFRLRTWDVLTTATLLLPIEIYSFFFDIGEYANIPKRKNSHILALDILTMAKMRMGFTNATRGIEAGFLIGTDKLQHLYWKIGNGFVSGNSRAALFDSFVSRNERI